MLQPVLILLHVFISILLIILVLLQQGKGAEMGATFGSAASQTVFGSQGSSSFLLKLTSLLALLFFITSLSLGYIVGHRNGLASIQRLSRLAQSSSPLQVNSTAMPGKVGRTSQLNQTERGRQ